MRQPTFSRRKTRQQRLLRTGIGVVLIVVVAALIANLAGGKKKSNTPPPGVAQVKFVAAVKGSLATPLASKGILPGVKQHNAKLSFVVDLSMAGTLYTGATHSRVTVVPNKKAAIK